MVRIVSGSVSRSNRTRRPPFRSTSMPCVDRSITTGGAEDSGASSGPPGASLSLTSAKLQSGCASGARSLLHWNSNRGEIPYFFATPETLPPGRPASSRIRCLSALPKLRRRQSAADRPDGM